MPSCELRLVEYSKLKWFGPGYTSISACHYPRLTSGNIVVCDVHRRPPACDDGRVCTASAMSKLNGCTKGPAEVTACSEKHLGYLVYSLSPDNIHMSTVCAYQWGTRNTACGTQSKTKGGYWRVP